MASKKQLTHSSIYYEGSLTGSNFNTDPLLLQTANKNGISFRKHTDYESVLNDAK